MNVLLIGAGRHTLAAEHFRAALAGDGRVFVADTDANVLALHKADALLITPPVNQSDYLEILFAFCLQKQISLIVPLGNAELSLLARANTQGTFAPLGTQVVVSSESVVGCCLDKWATHSFLRQQGILAPKTYSSLESAYTALERGDLVFPLIVKLSWGGNPCSPELICDEVELELTYKRFARRLTDIPLLSNGERHKVMILIQQFITGDEYSLDIVNDLQGNFATSLARRKLGIRAGETDSAVTVALNVLDEVGEAVGKKLGHVGCLDCDVFDDGEQTWVLGMKPRLGASYVFSHAAGANLPAALVAWAKNEVIDETWLRAEAGITAARYSAMLRF